jgi:putative ABC transport system permease protein
VPLWAIAAGFLTSASVGLIAGVWPAIRAARLDPVAAIRGD